ncbi:Glycosyl transferase family 2 [Sphingobium yanoikuyae]|uniref:Glycosyl transferase family 2 n=1 Tax=Sphingobium yanoikuyae TaxID=13690 RepID=A0A084EBF6_SPHYA|nr:glycosyltransferase family 2 protein [Sphingobium yanoikuyae]KEZ15298.1 Glycosyl transferase family 2 [Sphingobium yanoikuyae]
MNPAKNGPIAICMVSFRSPEQIIACLETLAATTYPDFEVIICENGGEAAFAALTHAVSHTLPAGQRITCLLAESNLGYAGGVNLCMASRPDAQAWWILNPDTQVEPGTLGALVARLERGDCDAVGGTLYHAGGTVQAYGGRWRPALARAESIGHGASLATAPDVTTIERDMNYLLGASMMIGRHFVEQVGLMREDYFLYAEEVEWCLRGIARGMRLGFAPDALVCHNQGETTGSATSIRERPRLPIFLDERNKILVVRDTRPAMLPIAVLTSLILGILRFARRRAWRQWGYALTGWWAGIRNQRGIPNWLR